MRRHRCSKWFRRRCAEGHRCCRWRCSKGLHRRGWRLRCRKWSWRRCAERHRCLCRFGSRGGKRHGCRCWCGKLRLFGNLGRKRLRFGSSKRLNLRLQRLCCKRLGRRVDRLTGQWRSAERLTPSPGCRCLGRSDRQRLHDRRLRRSFRLSRCRLRTSRCSTFVDAEMFGEDFVDFAVVYVEQCSRRTGRRWWRHWYRLLNNIAGRKCRRIDV